MTEIKALFFDAAGTLLHAHPGVGHVYAEVLAQYGAQVDAERLEEAFRASFRRRREVPPTNAPGPLENEGYDWWKALVFDVLRSEHIAVRAPDAFFHELYWRFAETDVWRLFPDALPALLDARGRGLKTALVSNWDVRLRRLIEGLGIAPLFDAIVISTEVGFEKPDPRIFRVACERLAVGPDAALHLGDNVREDLEGARAAGLRAGLVDRNASNQSEQVIHDLRYWHALL